MKPKFLSSIEEAFSVQKQAILTMNTEDRFYMPEDGIPPSNLNYFLANYFTIQGYRVAQYTPMTGIRELSPSGETYPAIREISRESDPIAISNGINRLLRNPKEKWLILMLYAERFAGSPSNGDCTNPGRNFGEILHTIGLDDAVSSSPSRLILVTFSGLPEDLLTRCRGFKLIEVDLPTYEERKAFIHFLEDLAKEGNTDFGELEEGLDSEALARLTAGMALTGIESCYRASAKFKKPITREQIRTVKANELRNLARDLLDVSEPQEGFEGVAGLVSIKSYFHEIIPQIKAGRPGVPQAFLLQGVPGCGKSHLVKALSKEIGWPLLELRNVRSPFVGQSEMNLDHVIRVVEQLQPAILFFDEIDQTLGQRGTGASGDSGTSERILARIFSWLGSLHLRGRLIFIGATNRPDILDPALLDRFGVSIPFLKPGIEEIKELIPLLMERFDRRFIEISLDEIAGILKDMFLTGRDIQEILIQAGLRADREMRQIGSEIKKDHLLQSIHDHISREDVIEMEFMTLISLSICSSQALLPWNSIDGIRDSGGIPEGLIEKGIVSNKGRLNRGKLQELISELKQIRFREKYTR